MGGKRRKGEKGKECRVVPHPKLNAGCATVCGFVLGSVHNFIMLPTVNGSLDLVLELRGIC